MGPRRGRGRGTVRAEEGRRCPELPLGRLGVVAGVRPCLTYVGCSSSATQRRPRDLRRSPDLRHPRPRLRQGRRRRPRRASSSPTGRSRRRCWSSRARWTAISSPAAAPQGQLGGLIRRFDFVERLQGPELARRPDRPGEPDQGPGRGPGRLRAGQDQVRHRPQGLLHAQVRRHRPERRGPEGRRRRGLGPVPQQPGRTDQDRRRPTWSPAPGFESQIQPSLIIPAGPVKLGVTAVVDPECSTS